MFDIGAALDAQIAELGGNRPTVLFIEPEDPRILEAAFSLPGFARPVFLASREQVARTIAAELGGMEAARVEFLLSESAFCPIQERSDLRDEIAAALLAAPGGTPLARDEDHARRLACDPAYFGIMATALGHADLVVGGARHEPKDYFRPLLKALGTDEEPCEAGFFVLPDSHGENTYPHNILVLGDVGANATATPESLAASAVSTCAVARDLIPENVLPRIDAAMVSYSNRGADEGPGAELVQKAAALVPACLSSRIQRSERYRSISIVSQIKISVALSARSARLYGDGGEFRGTNVIIAPNLDTGNLLFHLFATLYPDARKFVAVTGIGCRGVDLPMDVLAEDAALAVKATVLRLFRSGAWKRTPRDTFFPRPRILAINPGSTSTKLAVFEGEEQTLEIELQHRAEELAPFEGKPVATQFAFRKQAVEDFLAAASLSMADIDAVSARGGLLRPIPHGTYTVNQAMLDELRLGASGEHASNLGALIADALVRGSGKRAFIVDPVVVDEMMDRARISGVKALPRRAVSHALNQIAAGHRFAREKGTFRDRLNLVVCHMGGGVSIGAHRKGRVVDVNNALDGEGPFSPQRSGSLPVGDLIRLCFDGKLKREELLKLNKGRGGLIDLVGTSDFRAVEKAAAAGDAEAALAFQAMGYQIAKAIASMGPAFEGEAIDRVILTGGLARSADFVDLIRSLLGEGMGGVTVYPGEMEMVALAQGALRVLCGNEEARAYGP